MLCDFKNKGQSRVSYFCKHQPILKAMSKAKEQWQQSTNKWGGTWLYLAIIIIGKIL